jgi:hypothetical protein
MNGRLGVAILTTHAISLGDKEFRAIPFSTLSGPFQPLIFGPQADDWQRPRSLSNTRQTGY